ncbi:MAG: hypothetical protein PSX36_07925 [bacterium]|nr:hypothetical protein [bacterium]
MNVESLKSELQQVLENDVILRKEFNGLKRSLSDYRNQLIMRDEDCKRLQVTIDVLNTKLVVMERDNTTYKAELSSFKELRGTIKDQLEAKQEEIEARLQEIQGLRDDLNTMAANYEAKMEEMRLEAGSELERVTSELTQQISELRTNTQYKESGIREEFENRVTELTNSWADKEQNLVLNHEEEVLRLNDTHTAELTALSSQLTHELGGKLSASLEELEALKNSHAFLLSQREEEFTAKIGSLDEAYRAEVAGLRSALEEQRSTLTTNFNAQIEQIKSEYLTKENDLVAGYEKRLEEIQLHQHNSESETVSVYESRIAALVTEYEEKLSHTLIHSTSQNSKLNEELGKAQSEHEVTMERMNALTSELLTKNTELENFSLRFSEKEEEVKNEVERFVNLSNEFESFKQQTSLSVSEQVNELNQQIASLNLVHSDYVNELSTQIDNLNTELKNLGQLFETTTNSLSEMEQALELKGQDLEKANLLIEELQAKIDSFDVAIEEKELELGTFKTDLEATVRQELKEQKLEYDKLLAENTNLIDEIDSAQDKVEAQEQEITLLKGELEEVKLQSAGKSEYFKETLSNRNFEITNLEANNAAMNQEILQLKQEVSEIQAQVQSKSAEEVQLTELQERLNLTSSQNVELGVEIDALHTVISELNEKVEGMNAQLLSYEGEIGELKATTKSEDQEAFIDRLFKQIDALNDQRLVLLDEKEQMANQLLKMNDVVGSLSQQVDTEKIDVTGLNNHRKNVILANNSEGTTGKSQMKEQINDLVREIDKCIALLSA